jgi:hypothetical protein
LFRHETSLRCFTTDSWSNQEFFNPAAPCTFTDGPFTNRSLYINGDASVDYVWESRESGGLPAGLNNMDLGSALVPGYVNGGLCSGLGAGGYEITSSGIGNSFTQDNQYIVYKTLCGDGEVYAFAQASSVALSPATATINAFTVSNGTLFSASDMSDITLGNSFDEFGVGLTVYLNPAVDLLKIESNGIECMDCQVSLYNSLGQRVVLIADNILADSYLEVNVADFEPGIYLIKVEGAEQPFTQKAIIQPRN